MKKLFKCLILVSIMIFLSSCGQKDKYRDFRLKKGNLPSVMKITSIDTPVQYGDSIENLNCCYYTVRFENPILTGEGDFTIIDTIGKYKVGDRFPKIK